MNIPCRKLTGRERKQEKANESTGIERKPKKEE